MPWFTELPEPAIGAPLIRYLARISYAWYLIHWQFIYLAARVPETWSPTVYLGGSIAAATALSYCIEQPVMRLRPRQV